MGWREVKNGGPLPPARGYTQITDLSSAVNLTAPEGTSFVLIQAEQEDVRYRADGTNPTASSGMLITSGNEILYPATEETINLLAFIQTVSGAKLNVTFY